MKMVSKLWFFYLIKQASANKIEYNYDQILMGIKLYEPPEETSNLGS